MSPQVQGFFVVSGFTWSSSFGLLSNGTAEAIEVRKQVARIAKAAANRVTFFISSSRRGPDRGPREPPAESWATSDPIKAT